MPCFSIANVRATLAIVSVALLAACSGGASSSHLPQTTGGRVTAGKATLSLVLKIPARLSASGKRSPKYISTGTAGAFVTVTGTNSATSSAGFSLAPGSSTCPTSNGTTTCTLSVPVPSFGALTVAVDLYDQPVSTSVPLNAQLLSAGTIGVTVAEGSSAVSVPLVLSGVVEGVAAGGAGTLTIGSASQTTFIFNGIDGDGKIIASADGAVVRSGSAVSAQIEVPSITGITIKDATQPNGSFGTVVAGVKIGDEIIVATDGTTPEILGVPLFVTFSGQPVGILRIPATYSATAPQPVSTTFPGTVREIGGVPPWTVDGATLGNGFVYLAGTNVSGALVNAGHVASPGFSCSPATGTTINHIAKGNGDNVVVAETTTSDVTLNTIAQTNGQCPTGTTNFSAASQGFPSSISAINDVADDGIYAGGVLEIAGAGGNGVNFILSTFENSAVSGSGQALGSASTQVALDSLNLWYGKAVVLETGAAGVAYRTADNGLDTSSLGSTPIASAIDNAGVAYVLDTAGNLRKCTLGGSLACTTLTNIIQYSPAQDHRALVVGPDANVWLATSAGALAINPMTGSVTSYGGSAYQEVVASGDGHLYFLRAGGSAVDAFP